MTALARSSRRAFLAVLLPLAALWFGGLEYRGLFQPDEGRYAEIPREMLETGDWVTPRLNGLKYFEKPPLQYWATALSFAAFGEDEWSARLWPATTGFLGVLLLAFAGNRLGPPGTGDLAGMVLAGSVGYFLGAQYLTLDMALTFFLTGVLCALLVALSEATPPHQRRSWMLLAWASAALAVMTKGLIGFVLPAMALAAYVFVRRDWSLLRRLEWPRGIALFAVLVLPWHVLVQLRNPEFFSFYIVHEHFARYMLPEHHRPGAWWYFAVMLLLSALPWTTVLAGVVRRAARRAAGRHAGFDADALLLAWAVVILVFFSLSRSKLPAYILPVVPALALLVGRDIARRTAFEATGPGLLLALTGAVALNFGMPRLLEAMAIADLAFAYLPWLIAGAAVLVAGGVLAWRMRAERIAHRIAALTLTTVLGTQILLSGLHPMDDRFSAETFAERLVGVDHALAPGAPFYSIGYFDESLSFYLGRTFTLVAYEGELGPGIHAEPDKYIASIAEFELRWRAADDAYAAMRPQQYAAFKAEGLPMRLLGRDPVRVVVSRSREDLPRRPKNRGWLGRPV